MNVVPCPTNAIQPVSDKPPFAAVYVTLTKQEHIQLVMDANSWKGLHHKATQRAEWNERGDRLFKRPLSSPTAPRRHPEHGSTGEERSARSARTCLWMQAAICWT